MLFLPSSSGESKAVVDLYLLCDKLGGGAPLGKYIFFVVTSRGFVKGHSVPRTIAMNVILRFFIYMFTPHSNSNAL